MRQLVQELGGAETGPRAAYVESVGRRVGAYSGVANPGQALHFTTLNSAVENAFSVPGGYVYITRQLMALMDDESQLAFALGHEVGHIAANHAHIREQYARRNPLGVFGQIVGSDLRSGGLQQRHLRARAQARHAELLARAGISGRHARPALSDRGGLRSRRRGGMLAALSRDTALEARVQGRDATARLRNGQAPTR